MTDTGENSFHRLHPERDLQLNWEVDLAHKLESYLLQICSGELLPGDDENCIAVNFAEAALLLQGSIQVYSRKVEYLYSLVLRALEFLSQKRQEDHLEGTSVQAEESGSHKICDDENDVFWVSEDIPAESKNTLECTKEDAWLHKFVKPPANLVVLEGECLDAAGDGGELDSYLLATTSDIYQDFILLDPCDAEAVQDFLKGGNKFGQGQNSVFRGSSTRKSFQSPSRRSGGNVHKSSVGKNQGANVSQSPLADCRFNNNDCNAAPDPPFCDNFYNGNHEFDTDVGYSEPMDSYDSDDDADPDPWKPLNPHEPGNLKIKPFRKVKAFKKNYFDSRKHDSVATLFPLAKLHGPISPEFATIFEMRNRAFETQRKSTSPSLYEKLRNSLINEDHGRCDATFDVEDDNDDNGYEYGFDPPDTDAPNTHFMDESMHFENEKHDAPAHFDNNEAYVPEYPNSQASLEDLCRSHLDALLASITETEKQTEMAIRVSNWKQKIEHNLEEQDIRPPFDIQEYGKTILEELSGEADRVGVMSFSDVVKGQEKFNVARSFSALLQLVNNGDVELDKTGIDGESICYTAVNPFHVRLVCHDKPSKPQHQMSRKRSTSPSTSGNGSCDEERHINNKPSHVNNSTKESRMKDLSSHQNRKFPVKPGKVGGLRCTPESKRRRRSRFAEPVDLHSTG